MSDPFMRWAESYLGERRPDEDEIIDMREAYEAGRDVHADRLDRVEGAVPLIMALAEWARSLAWDGDKQERIKNVDAALRALDGDVLKAERDRVLREVRADVLRFDEVVGVIDAKLRGEG